MLTYFLFTVLFILAGNFILRLFFEMVQPQGLLDIVFGWQKMLGKLYNGSQAQQLLGKALGDCERCTSFWFMPFWFGLYYFMCSAVLHKWITDPVTSLAAKVLINFIWYSVFHSIGACWGFFFLLLKRKSNGM